MQRPNTGFQLTPLAAALEQTVLDYSRAVAQETT